MFKRLVLAALLVLTLAGCMDPYDESASVDAATTESTVPLTDLQKIQVRVKAQGYTQPVTITEPKPGQFHAWIETTGFRHEALGVGLVLIVIKRTGVPVKSVTAEGFDRFIPHPHREVVGIRAFYNKRAWEQVKVPHNPLASISLRKTATKYWSRW